MKKILLSLLALCLFALPVQAESFKLVDIDLPAGYKVQEGPLLDGETAYAMVFEDAKGNAPMVVLLEESDDTLQDIENELKEDLKSAANPGVTFSRKGNIMYLTDESGKIAAETTKVGKMMVVIAYEGGVTPDTESIVASLYKNLEKRYGTDK